MSEGTYESSPEAARRFDLSTLDARLRRIETRLTQLEVKRRREVEAAVAGPNWHMGRIGSADFTSAPGSKTHLGHAGGGGWYPGAPGDHARCLHKLTPEIANLLNMEVPPDAPPLYVQGEVNFPFSEGHSAPGGPAKIGEMGARIVGSEPCGFGGGNLEPEPEQEAAAFDPTKPVRMADGRRARIICTDRRDHAAFEAAGEPHSIIALISHKFGDGDEQADFFRADGTRSHGSPLVNIPDTHERWINLYLDGSSDVYESREDADEGAANADAEGGLMRLACAYVAIREGEGL